MRVPVTLSLLAALAVSVGCMGRIVPQTIQAGSTIVIPLNSQAELGPVGFGGTEISDPQRGELVYTLDTPNGPVELTTRGSTLVTTHAGSARARGAPPANQIFSMVDVPADAPLGTYPVDVVWRHTDPATGALVEETLSHQDEISILPNEITVDGLNGTETITGTPTPFERWSCNLSGNCSWSSVDVSGTVPNPAFAITFDTRPWAVELEVIYPDSVIGIVDAYQAPLALVNERASTWFEDDGAGTLTLNAAGNVGVISDLRVGFNLVDPATAGILDPANVTVNVLNAYDQDGNPISVTASVGEIF